MLRTWKSFGLVALTLSLLAAPGARTRGDDKSNSDNPAPIKETLSKIQQSLDEIKNKLKNLENLPNDTLKNTQDIQKNTKDIEKFATATKSLADQISNEMNKLNSRIDKLEDQVRANSTRVARSFDPQAAANSTIRLQNRSGVATTVIVGSAAYPLGPYETRLLEKRPAGTFSYEVIADGFGTIQDQVTRTLAPNEIFTIDILPSR